MPRGLELAILRCLEKDKQNRYGNIAEMAMALVEFGPKRARASAERISRTVQAAGLSASALALPPSSEINSEPPKDGTMASWGQTSPRTSGGRRGLLGAVAFVALVFAGAGAVFLLRKTTVTSASTVVAAPPAPTPAAPPIAPLAEVPAPVAPAPTVSSPALPLSAATPEKPPVTARTETPRVSSPATRQPPATPPAQRSPATPPPTTKPGDLGGRY
jgi:hypothetical protein